MQTLPNKTMDDGCHRQAAAISKEMDMKLT